MGIGDRIKAIRENAGLSQTAFASRLRIGPSSIHRIENGTNHPADRTVDLICREFGVREEWLRTGEGDMYAPDLSVSLDEIARECGATPLELELVKVYFSFSDPTRREIREKVWSAVKALANTEDTAQPDRTVHDWTPDEMADEARRQGEAEQADRKKGDIPSSISGPGSSDTA